MEKTSPGTYDTDAEINPETEIYSEYGREKVKYRRKNAFLAALLSCIILGLGQVYAGDPLR
ncbi:hypothetical protein [Methanosarcina sp. UBA5]|uniref:hypothetical protein n=1 Tax=Methanosarcina sp. UBA5 TaxID=1915593 RepID=UPI0025D21D99|nr:hypothetical protein [Methanosarcina sp. UBA5]